MLVLDPPNPRLLPIVMPSSTPFELLSSVTPSLLTIVPLAMVPVSEVRPPVPNGPADPMSSVPPPSARLPDRLMLLPAPRENVPSEASVRLPVSVSVAPGSTLVVPVLTRLLPERLKLPPWMLIVPVFVQLVGLTVSVPAVTRSVPLLVRFVGLSVKVCPTVLAISVPLLTMVATELSPKVP